MTRDVFLIKTDRLRDAYQEFDHDLSVLSDPNADHSKVLERLQAELSKQREQMEKMTHSRSDAACQMANLQLDYCSLLEKVLKLGEDHDNEEKDEYLALASEYAIDFAVYAMKLALYMNYEKEARK